MTIERWPNKGNDIGQKLLSPDIALPFMLYTMSIYNYLLLNICFATLLGLHFKLLPALALSPSDGY